MKLKHVAKVIKCKLHFGDVDRLNEDICRYEDKTVEVTIGELLSRLYPTIQGILKKRHTSC